MRNVMISSLFMLSVMAVPSTVLADDNAELTALLTVFLDGATRNDANIHEQFWADELIYTSSAGKRFGKAELMQGVRSRGELSATEIDMQYRSEDVRIMQYGDTAVVAFILVGQTTDDTVRFFNSGTFVKRAGKWQAVNWQATRLTE